ncbi:porin [Pirellulaceae bacterium SH449]
MNPQVSGSFGVCGVAWFLLEAMGLLLNRKYRLQEIGRTIMPRFPWVFGNVILVALSAAFGTGWAADLDSEKDQEPSLPPIQRVMAAESPRASDPSPFFVGYNRGFVIAHDGKEGFSASDYPFVMRMSSWLQLRHVLFDSDIPDRDKNSFTLERIRLSFGGHLYSPDLKYSLMLDGNTDQSVQVTFLDSFVTYDVGRGLWGYDEGRLEIRGGNWKVPFSRSREESARRFQFTERSVANLFFDIGRSVGVSVLGESDSTGIPIRFETAMMNGLNTGRDSTLSGEDLDANLAWSGRCSADVLGDFGSDGEPDLDWRSSPVWRLGAGLALTSVDRTGQAEFLRQRVVSSGDRISNLLPESVSQYDIRLFTLDSHWKYRGWSVILEHHWRTLSSFRGGNIPSLIDRGIVVQTGYFIVPEKFELLARWSAISGDSGTLGGRNEHTKEIAGGFAWYIRGHDLKFNLDVARIDGVPVNSPRLNLLPGDYGWLMRTQFQFAF